MNKKVLMIYQIPEGDAIKRITFNRKVFAYNLQSHNGKYKRKSQGLLTEYEKPIRSCIIFEHKYILEIRKICEKLAISFKIYEIVQIID